MWALVLKTSLVESVDADDVSGLPGMISSVTGQVQFSVPSSDDFAQGDSGGSTGTQMLRCCRVRCRSVIHSYGRVFGVHDVNNRVPRAGFCVSQYKRWLLSLGRPVLGSDSSPL